MKPFYVMISSAAHRMYNYNSICSKKALRYKLLFILITFTLTFSGYGQTADPEYAEDVRSIDAIINAYYDVVSGAEDEPWQFNRDQHLHSKNAMISRFSENGTVTTHSLEAEYIPLLLSPKADFYEKELKRKVSHFGNMAQVWSAFEIRSDPKIETDTRGLNSIQLYFEDGRWWIGSWTCEMETENNPLVTEFLSGE